MSLKRAVLFAGLSIIASPAWAQTSVPPAGSKQVIPEKQGAPVQGGSSNLSSKLSKSNGVIKPQGDVDPGMKVPPPDASAHPMPVIPPSATGGGTAK